MERKEELAREERLRVALLNDGCCANLSFRWGDPWCTLSSRKEDALTTLILVLLSPAPLPPAFRLALQLPRRSSSTKSKQRKFSFACLPHQLASDSARSRTLAYY